MNDYKYFDDLNIELIDGDRGKNYPRNDEMFEKGYCLFLNAKNVTINGFVFDENVFITKEKDELLRKGKLNRNDIVLTTRGTIGNVGLYDESVKYDNVRINSGMLIIRNNDLNINTKYLYYQLTSPFIRDQIFSLKTGSAQPQIPITVLKKLKLLIPDKNIQDKIVKVMDSVVNKIKLNNEINNNLYDLMKIKFNDYIDNLDEYEESVLSKIANYKNGLAMQNYRPTNENGLPVIKIKEMNSGITSETERCRSDIDEEVIINDGDVLFAWSGTLCMNIWCGGKAGLNQHIFKVTSDKYPKWFYYFWTLKHLDNFIEIAAGKATTMGHIKRTELDKALVKIPSDKSINEMNKIFEPMLNKYVNTNIENRNLSILRDTLLPKLMNGEIDLDNIEV